MFDWIKASLKRQKIPEYSAVRERPNRGLPSDLVEQEAGEAHNNRRDELERLLLESPGRAIDIPRFVEIIDNDEQSLLTIPRPERESHCLLVFSTPFRATDYVRTVFNSDTSRKYLTWTPSELLTMLRDLREVNVDQFTIDRCPRCKVFCAIDSTSVNTIDDVERCWSIFKAGELARLDLYLTHAQASARGGELYRARDVLLETVAHVSAEDPRVHLLLGQVAVALYDRELLRETKAYLQFFQFNSWERRLDEAVRSGSPNFEL